MSPRGRVARRIARHLALLALYAMLGVMSCGRSADAHEMSMAVLALQEFRPGEFISRWVLTPGFDTAALHPVFPAHCAWEPPKLDCGARGLSGTLGFDGLGRRQSAVMYRVTRLDGTTQAYTLTATHPTMTVVEDPNSLAAWTELAAAYVNIGIDHILLGVDHLLFVLGLILLVRGTAKLVETITAFTVAHSLSLAAATFGWVGVPERAVNASIALSIVFVGVELIRAQRGQHGLTVRYPWAVAFSFGLLHGLGFASALSTLGIPQATLPYALLFFNVGVEIGQIAFVFLVLALKWAHRTAEAHLPRWSAPLPAYALGAIASFWFISRMAKIIIT
jgi:hydrogenase/urease accessory protein HupE